METGTRRAVLFVLSLMLAGVAGVSTALSGQAGVGRIEQPASLIQIRMHGFASSCEQDGEIPSEKLAAINNQGLLFVHAALGPDPAKAYQSFASPELQKKVSSEQFAQFMQQQVDPLGPFDPIGIAHTYFANVVGQPQGEWMECGTLGKPQDLVSFRFMPSSKQAWVLISGKARNNTWTFTTWLVQVGGRWRIDSFTANISTLAKLSAVGAWELAHREEEQQHWFNAFIFYSAAIQLAWRGPSFRLGIAPVIRKQMAKIQVPGALHGKPPYVWAFGARTFKVLRVGPIAVAGKVYLDIAYQAQPWRNYNQVDHENRVLIQDFASKHPEYAAVFAGIIGEAHEIGTNRGFRTVEVLRNGSLVSVK